MNFYFAPLEGITGYLYRNTHHTYFDKVDKYFSPFIFANQHEGIKGKDVKDILPENNQGVTLVPQILTNNAKDFIYTAKKFKQLGYDEVNLKLGCPSGTVVSRHRGSGFLAKQAELDVFLDEVFSEAVTKISIKTRIGKDHPDEFYELLQIYNKYPMEELIIHPRIQKDFYKNTPNLDVFGHALSQSKNPICYNGDLFTADAYKRFMNDFPSITKVMLGRGLLANPGLISEITDGVRVDKNTLRVFHDKIYEDYKKVLFGDRNVMFKMKELWFYMITQFTENEKYWKKIKKVERCSEYDVVIAKLFEEQELCEQPDFLTWKKC
ncbi:MAG: dihydrouridine synthase DuS [Herbinix sp.]|nr:dihydrouridine synthase DuS [Herbinix sp.]